MYFNDGCHQKPEKLELKGWNEFIDAQREKGGGGTN